MTDVERVRELAKGFPAEEEELLTRLADRIVDLEGNIDSLKFEMQGLEIIRLRDNESFIKEREYMKHQLDRAFNLLYRYFEPTHEAELSEVWRREVLGEEK